MDKMNHNQLGQWAFLIGVLLAIVLGLFPGLSTAGVSMLFLVLGLVVGFLNISEEEYHSFLLVVVTLLLVGTGGLGELPGVGVYISPILDNIGSFVGPAALVVALTALVKIGRNKSEGMVGK